MTIENILNNELEALNELLNLLEKQFKLLMKKELFELESIVEEIKLSNKKIAEWEVERRKIVKTNSMSEYIDSLNEKKIDNLYREIKKVISSVKIQKDTNELLIKQSLSFNHQILNILNPKREIKTYNSYGSLRR